MSLGREAWKETAGAIGGSVSTPKEGPGLSVGGMGAATGATRDRDTALPSFTPGGFTKAL